MSYKTIFLLKCTKFHIHVSDDDLQNGYIELKFLFQFRISPGSFCTDFLHGKKNSFIVYLILILLMLNCQTENFSEIRFPF